MTHLMTMLVLQLAVIIVTAKILGWIFENKLNQPRVLGELAAGMIIGPYALGGNTYSRSSWGIIVSPSWNYITSNS